MGIEEHADLVAEEAKEKAAREMEDQDQQQSCMLGLERGGSIDLRELA